MNDQILVGKRDGAANLDEQPQAFFDRKLLLLGETNQRLAGNEFHGQEEFA